MREYVAAASEEEKRQAGMGQVGEGFVGAAIGGRFVRTGSNPWI